MPSRGYTGAILRVDLSTGRTETVETRRYAGRLLGGRGLAAGIYWEEVPPEVGPFDEGNRLIVATGPLAGIPALGGSRWGVFARSPLPARPHFCYGNLGGFFGAELKFAGWDGLIVQGRADRPVVLSLRGGRAEVRAAGGLWGRSAIDTLEALKAGGGPKARAFAIGPAGERGVPFATLFADGHASCAGGMGAVMGSKNLKAVTVEAGERAVEAADPARLQRVAHRFRGFGRGNVKVWGFDFMAHGPKTAKMPCYGCQANCLRVRYTADDGRSGKYMCQSRFFYFPYALLFYGDENDVPFLANRACDAYGVDTWRIQELIEWLGRCFEAGVITEGRAGLPLSQIGSLEFIEALVRAVALREGFGELLARGADRAAAELGEAALAQVRHSDPYDPRYCTVNTLLFPFEPRQPIQQLHEAGLVLSQWSSRVKGVEGAHIDSAVVRGIARRFWGGEKAADFTTLEGKALAARRIQDRQHAKECLVVCDWMYPVLDIPRGGGPGGAEDHVGDPSLESEVLSAVTGERFAEEDLARVGERVFNLQRAILLREGHRAREDDVLPADWHDQPLEGHIADAECLVPGPDGEPASRLGAVIDRGEYGRIRDEYYALRGWEAATGLPTRALLEGLGLPEVAGELARRGLLGGR